jgi:hypothetical protein
MALRLLTGTPGAPRARSAQVSEPQPVPDRSGELLDVMRGTLEYLKKDPEARAKEAAEPLVAAEREARAVAERERAAALDELERLRAAPPAPPPPEHERTIAELRAMLGSAQDDGAAVRAELERTRGELEADRAERTRLAEEHERVKRALEARPTPIVQAPDVQPKDITILPRRDIAGFLREVVLKAPGRNDITISINRGGNGRMQSMKVR